MFSSLSILSSNTSTGSSSTSCATTEILGTTQSQSLEEKIPWTSKEKVEEKLDSILTQVQQNQVKRLDLTAAMLGRFYELTHTLSEHTDNINIRSLVVLKNSVLAYGSEDRTIKIWDLVSNSCLSTLRGHTDSIWVLAVLLNDLLASGSGDRTIKIWDLTSYSCLFTLEGHTDSLWSLAALPNGQLASGSLDTTIKLWNLASHPCLFTLQGHTHRVSALTILPSGQLASGSWDETIKIWDLSSHACLFTLEGHTRFISALAMLPNGQLASGSNDNTIKLWDLASHSCLFTLKGHTDFVSALVALPNGLLASGSWDSTIKIWDLASNSCLSTLQGHIYCVYALAVLPNGQLASGAGDKIIKLWEPKTLSAKQLPDILNALENNTSVTDLDLSGNRDILDDIIDPLISIFTSDTSSGPKSNTSLKTIDLRRTGVSQKGVRKLEKSIQHERLSIEVLADCPIEWKMIYFLIVFCRANRNSPFADSGLDLCKYGELGSFLGVPPGFFAWPRKNSSATNFSKRIALSPS